MCKTLSESIEVIKESTVQIGFAISGLDEELRKKVQRNWVRQPAGSGFFVSYEGHVITALHVIEGMEKTLSSVKGKEKKMYVNVPLPPLEDVVNKNLVLGTFIPLDFDIVDRDEAHDIALLKLKTNPFTREFMERSKKQVVIGGKSQAFVGRPVSFNARRPGDGSHIAVSGFPLGEASLITNSGFVATSWATYKNPSKPKNREFNVYLGDVQVNFGNSGGSVYLVEDGSVIGMCVAHKLTPAAVKPFGFDIRTNSGLTIIVPAKHVVEMLKKNSVNFEYVK